MSSPKTRRTVTRRSPQKKMLDLLEEMKGMIERHCGERVEAATAAAKQAVREVLAMSPEKVQVQVQAPTGLNTLLAQRTGFEQPAMEPMVTSEAALMQPMVMKKKSGGPKLWNEFVTKYIAEQRAMGSTKPNNEIVKNAAVAFKQYKSNQGLPEGRAVTRKLPRQPVGNSVAAFKAQLQGLNAQRAALSAKVSEIASAIPRNERTAPMLNKLQSYATPSTAYEQEVQNAINAMSRAEMTPAKSRAFGKTLNKATRRIAKESARMNKALKSLNVPLPVMETLGRASPVEAKAEEGSVPSAKEALAKRRASKAPKESRKKKAVQIGLQGATPKEIREFNKSLPPSNVGSRVSSFSQMAKAPSPAKLPSPPKLPSPVAEEDIEFNVDTFGNIGSASKSSTASASSEAFEPVSAAAPPVKSAKQMIAERRASASASKSVSASASPEENSPASASPSPSNIAGVEFMTNSNKGQEVRKAKIKGTEYRIFPQATSNGRYEVLKYDPNANDGYGDYGLYNPTTGEITGV